MENFDLVVGIHSIVAALENSARSIYKLVATEDAVSELKKKVDLKDINIQLVSSHKVQEESKQYFKQLDLEYQRVPSGAFLLCSELQTVDIKEFYAAVEHNNNLKILCLDQLSDVHNAAAILRTASFYGVDFVIVPDKKSFGLTPSFFRIASGAAENVKLVSVNKLTKVITKLTQLNVFCVALSEHAKGDYTEALNEENTNKCIVVGKEDVGISNAVLRLIPNHMCLDSSGYIKSLNVSIAAAITMERCFKKK